MVPAGLAAHVNTYHTRTPTCTHAHWQLASTHTPSTSSFAALGTVTRPIQGCCQRVPARGNSLLLHGRLLHAVLGLLSIQLRSLCIPKGVLQRVCMSRVPALAAWAVREWQCFDVWWRRWPPLTLLVPLALVRGRRLLPTTPSAKIAFRRPFTHVFCTSPPRASLPLHPIAHCLQGPWPPPPPTTTPCPRSAGSIGSTLRYACTCT